MLLGETEHNKHEWWISFKHTAGMKGLSVWSLIAGPERVERVESDCWGERVKCLKSDCWGGKGWACGVLRNKSNLYYNETWCVLLW